MFNSYLMRKTKCFENNRSIVDLFNIFEQLMKKEEEVALHCYRTALIAGEISFMLTKNKKFSDKVFMSGLLHDIGKLETPKEILKSTGKLSDSKRIQVQKHPVDGALIAQKSGVTDGLILDVIFTHHKRFDMTGYPCDAQPQKLASSIISVCDAFDAMCYSRPYAKPKSVPEAGREISNGSGTQFHPKIAKHFLNFVSSCENDEFQQNFYENYAWERPKVVVLC